MTVVSGPVTQSQLVPRVTRSAALRWKEQGSVLELRSPDTEIVEIARRIFAVRSILTDEAPTRTWTVEHAMAGDGDVWCVSGRSETDSMIPVSGETRDQALLHIEQDALDFLMRNAGETAAVHAALLSKNGRGVAIVGPSLAGKSTLATALWRSGWSLMSDDIAFIDARRRTAAPAPRRVSLRFESRELVGEELWNAIQFTPSCIETSKGLFFHPHELSALEKLRETPLSAIFFLARRDVEVGEAETRRINPAKAALALVPYAFNIRTLPFLQSLERISPLAAAIPAYDLGRGDLASMVKAVEDRVG